MDFADSPRNFSGNLYFFLLTLAHGFARACILCQAVKEREMSVISDVTGLRQLVCWSLFGVIKIQRYMEVEENLSLQEIDKICY